MLLQQLKLLPKRHRQPITLAVTVMVVMPTVVMPADAMRQVVEPVATDLVVVALAVDALGTV